MWCVITKLVASCKDDVQLIKVINFKAIALFLRIVTRLISHRVFGNELILYHKELVIINSSVSVKSSRTPIYKIFYLQQQAFDNSGHTIYIPY